MVNINGFYIEYAGNGKNTPGIFFYLSRILFQMFIPGFPGCFVVVELFHMVYPDVA